MSHEDNDLREMLDPAGMRAEPDPASMQSVHDRMMALGCRGYVRRHHNLFLAMSGILLAVTTAAGIAGTEAGRNFVRRILTPIVPSYALSIDGKTSPDGTSSVFTVSRMGKDAQPFSQEEADRAKSDMREIEAQMEAGGGRLVGIMEGPGLTSDQTVHTVYLVEYTLKDGRTSTVGQGLTSKQVANLKVDEILALRDTGAGEIVSQKPSPIGPGRYTIRFTLSDGSTIDLTTNYPPGPRQDREAVFAETRELKKALRFTVIAPTTAPNGHVWGTLQYKLADGRTIGIVEQVPPEAVTADGQQVAVPEDERDDTAQSTTE